jgi:hypothetical protein
MTQSFAFQILPAGWFGMIGLVAGPCGQLFIHGAKKESPLAIAKGLS